MARRKLLISRSVRGTHSGSGPDVVEPLAFRPCCGLTSRSVRALNRSLHWEGNTSMATNWSRFRQCPRPGLAVIAPHCRSLPGRLVRLCSVVIASAKRGGRTALQCRPLLHPPLRNRLCAGAERSHSRFAAGYARDGRHGRVPAEVERRSAGHRSHFRRDLHGPIPARAANRLSG